MHWVSNLMNTFHFDWNAYSQEILSIKLGENIFSKDLKEEKTRKKPDFWIIKKTLLGHCFYRSQKIELFITLCHITYLLRLIFHLAAVLIYIYYCHSWYRTSGVLKIYDHFHQYFILVVIAHTISFLFNYHFTVWLQYILKRFGE